MYSAERHRWLFCCVLLFGICGKVAIEPVAARAQSLDPRPAAASGIVVLLTNAGIGAATAVLGRLIARKPVGGAALNGALAGTIVLGGKFIIAQDNDATNFLGRAIASAGSSAIYNAASERCFACALDVPYGVFRIHIKRPSGRLPQLRIRLDLATSIATAVMASDASNRFELRRSVLSGVPFFLVDPAKPDGSIGGEQIAGVITYRVRTAKEVLANDQLS